VPGAGAAIALLTVVVALNMGGPNSDPPIIDETEHYVDTDDSQELIQQPVYNPPPVIAAKIKVPPTVRPKPAPSAKPVPVTPTGGMNLAKGKPATASSTEKDRKPAMGADGNSSTRWCAVDGNANHWWQVDLGKVEKLGSCHIRWEFNGRLYKYRIEGSTDNKNWKTLVDYSGNKNDKKQLQKHNLGGQSARYIRIKPTALPSGSWFTFFEFEVFGAK